MGGLALGELVDYVREHEQRLVDIAGLSKVICLAIELVKPLGARKVHKVQHRVLFVGCGMSLWPGLDVQAVDSMRT